MRRNIFREVALQRLSSPEELDQLMQVTDSRGWMSLLALWALLSAALLWGFMGQIPSQVVGEGILMRGERVYTVVAPYSGQISEMLVRPGDMVRQGQPLARISALGNLINGQPSTQASAVLSPYAGRVVEIRTDRGAMIALGSPMLSLEDAVAPLAAVLYMPPAEGKKIQPGMPVQVLPASVNKAEYGVMRGRVSSVAQFPATYEGMMLVLAHDQLVRFFLRAGAPIEVRVQLEPAPGSPSGYQWSSSSGPPFEIQSGVLCQATITLSQQRPIDLVLPLR